MSILMDDISKTFVVCQNGKVLASFEKVEDAKKYWADYKVGKVGLPKGNDVEASKKAPKLAPKKSAKLVDPPKVKKTPEIAKSKKTAKASPKKKVKKN